MGKQFSRILATTVKLNISNVSGDKTRVFVLVINIFFIRLINESTVP